MRGRRIKVKFDLYVEVNGNKVLHKDILEKLKETWKNDGNLVKDLKSVEVYYKPLESKVYYIANEKTSGSFDV